MGESVDMGPPAVSLADGRAARQLASFFAVLSGQATREAAILVAARHVTEVFDAQVGAVLAWEMVIAAVGAPPQESGHELIKAAAVGPRSIATLPGVGECEIAVVPVGGVPDWHLLVGRAAGRALSDEELSVLETMGGMLAQTLAMLDTVLRERALRAANDQHGAAIFENRLVIIDDYARSADAVPTLQADQLAAAMAAPVHENGLPVGSLAVAAYVPGRTYSEEEQEALLAFAEHASPALADACTVNAMREAQRTKDLSLAMVSHELKTPLTVIMGTLRTLQKHAVALPPETRSEMIETAFGRGRELERMIDRPLRGARAELADARVVTKLTDPVTAAVSGFDQIRRIVVFPMVDREIEADAAGARIAEAMDGHIDVLSLDDQVVFTLVVHLHPPASAAG